MKPFRLLLVGLLAGVWILLPLDAGLAQENPPVSEEELARFETLIQSEMAYFHIPGAAVAVIQDGEVIYSKGFGVRDVATGEPFTPQTQFRIGSTTKSMTALLIAQWVDEGVLTWDTPVVEIDPTYQTSDPALTTQLTVRDLIGMGTGLEADPLTSLGWGEWTEADLFSTIAAMPAAGEFRSHYAYNNEVYASAAYVGALAAGQPPTLENYITQMQTRLFDPVGMTSTLITDDVNQLTDNASRSYSFNLINGVSVPDPVLPAPIHVVAPAGAVWTTLDDMSRYVITQMNGGVTPDGKRIVSEKNLSQTWQPQTVIPSEDPEITDMGYGMGWVIGTYQGIPFRYHDGGWDGYRTMMTILPDTQTGLIIFCNHTFGDLFNAGLMYGFADLINGGDPQPVLDDIHRAYEESFGSIEAQLAFLPPPEVKADDVGALLGDYEQGWRVELRDDNLLWLIRPHWEFMLRPLPGDNLYVISSSGALGVTMQWDVTSTPVTVTFDMSGQTWTLAKIG
jgi:CubicO group peptidase (beta-lactamase class C family)